MRELILVLMVACLGIAGCGAKTVSELKAEPSLHEQLKVNLHWQRATQIAKNAFEENHVSNLTCTIYSELREAECIPSRFSILPGIRYVAVIKTKKIDYGSTVINMFAYYNTSYLRSCFDEVKKNCITSRK